VNGLHKHMPPPPLAITASIKAMGQGLAGSCNELAQEPSIQNCDGLIHKLKGASQAVSQFRRALMAGGSGNEQD
jgi:hypothetical protein